MIRRVKEFNAFDHPFWDRVRDIASRKPIEIREQGFFGRQESPVKS